MKRPHYKTVLVAINAQFIHTGLGARSIAAYIRQETDFDVSLLEVTINHREADILRSLYERRADAYLFSCYIWNIEMILRIVRDLRLLCPKAVIGLGGPQVGYQNPTFLWALPEVDFIFSGEGEKTACHLLCLLAAKKPLEECPGILYRKGAQVVTTAARPPVPLDELPFPYPDIGALPHRIVYYESMRGCPFACSYCTSSIEHGVRKRSLSLVFQELAVLLDHRVKQVKFVDRTFNCDPERSRAIWEWLARHDNGTTCFHFELSGELLGKGDLAFLSNIRPGLFQLEIGVQSTCPVTLTEIKRPSNTPRLLERIMQLMIPQNIRIHLDLIAGLPYEDYDRFPLSFNQVYACSPHQIQLGVLKILSGSKMEKDASRHGIVCSANAPYEVLRTRWIQYGQLGILRGVARMLDVYHNSARFSHIVRHLISSFPNPFIFYQQLWLYFESETEGMAISEMGYYDLLAGFMEKQGLSVTEELQWIAKYDLLSHEKPRKLPGWVAVDLSGEYREQIRRFFMNPSNIAQYLPEYGGESSTRVERMAHLEFFPFNPATRSPGVVAAVFNYKRRTILGSAFSQFIPPETLQAENINA